eukprot:TRINITY_DN1533_c0_g1_i4.p2 TRINITY_DN1533_c0_g1~~TRINITY_DN1533_c0_g1_i4.p2  ORF type:complete len:102 (-),score=20.21 TRINITY_DN1533_c0_g1_i4:147-452(-)
MEATAETREVTAEQLLANQEWLLYDGQVYDFAEYEDHPGGVDFLIANNGVNRRAQRLCLDCKIDFDDIGHGPEARALLKDCLLYTSPSPRDRTRSRMPSSA